MVVPRKYTLAFRGVGRKEGKKPKSEDKEKNYSHDSAVRRSQRDRLNWIKTVCGF